VREGGSGSFLALLPGEYRVLVLLPVDGASARDTGRSVAATVAVVVTMTGGRRLVDCLHTTSLVVVVVARR